MKLEDRIMTGVNNTEPDMLRITCKACSRVYRVASRALPRKGRFSFPCPHCKEPIFMDLTPKPSILSPSKTRFSVEHSSKSESSDQANQEDPLKWRIQKSTIIKRIEDLPAMPQVIARAQEIMADDLAGIKDLSEVLGMDQAMMTRILKLANSAYYGLSGRVYSLNQACVLLGQTSLKEVVITAGLSALMDKELKGYGYAAEDLWHHSLAVAISARGIARIRYPQMVQEAYVAGLVHDAGKIVLDPYVEKARSGFESFLSDDPDRTFFEAETSVLGFNHAEIAYDICRKWHIPKIISEAIGCHHKPSKSEGNAIAYMVNMADHVARSSGFGYGVDDLLYLPAEGVAEYLKLGEVQLNALKAQAIEGMFRFSSVTG